MKQDDRVGIISVDGHVAPSRVAYRDYLDPEFRDDYDRWTTACEQDGRPPGGLHPDFDPAVQWDSDLRLRELEAEGVIAEVLFPNDLPFTSGRVSSLPPATWTQLRAGERAYNRWLAEFCAAAPHRRAGQAVVSFDDTDAAVADIRRAKEQGLGGIMMPALRDGENPYFFDPVLDPIWAAIRDVALPSSQHGGAGSPDYRPAGYSLILTLALEQSFFAGRSLWQMIVGGVFDRFPELQLVFVETTAGWIAHKINELDVLLQGGDEWTAFASYMNRERPFRRTGAEYWEQNCWAGASPFAEGSIPVGDLADDDRSTFRVRADRVMFGCDYPHFESIVPNTRRGVALLLANVDDDRARAVLYENAARVYGFDLEALRPELEHLDFRLDDARG